MSGVALALYLVGLLTVFGVRTTLHRRRTGSSGFHGVSGKPGSAPWWGGVLFVLALLTGVSAPLLAVTGAATPPEPLTDRPVLQWAGLLVALAGFAGVLVAQSGMGASWRIGVDEQERTDLVTSGVFGVVRNPIFTTMVTAQLGILLLVPTWLSLVAVVLLVLAVEIQVRVVEEPYLKRMHGAVFAAYTARTGRFVPRVSHRRSSRPAEGTGPPPTGTDDERH